MVAGAGERGGPGGAAAVGVVPGPVEGLVIMVLGPGPGDEGARPAEEQVHVADGAAAAGRPGADGGVLGE